ncbi:MAG: TRAP transporter small permease subunit [Bacillaceae bacterium]|nr:TRAP transporter small permease subunit [Bacillaceae bacterium]
MKITRMIKFIDRINEKIASLFSWMILITVFALCYEVIMRYIFNAPTLWSYDITYMVTSLFIVMGLAYNLKIGGHVSVDIIFNRFSIRTQALINIIFYLLLFFPTWVLIVKIMIPHVMQSWAWKETASTGTWMPPIYPFKTWILIGIVIFILQGLAQFLRSIQTLITGGGEQDT